MRFDGAAYLDQFNYHLCRLAGAVTLGKNQPFKAVQGLRCADPPRQNAVGN